MIRQLRDDILFASRQEQDVVVSGGFCTSQTERRATLLADSLLMKEMQRITIGIENSWNEVSDDVKVVSWVKYGLSIGEWKPPFGVVANMNGLDRHDLSHQRMSEICGLDERTWYRCRAKFVYKVAEKLGWY